MIPTLRDHQARAMGEMREAVRAGKRGVLVVMPTGGGKTCLAAHAAASHIAKGGRVVWFAHRRELVRQAAETLRRFDLPVGADGLNASAPVQVVSVQGSLMRGEVPPGSLCVFDEAHHFAGAQWKTLLHAYPDSFRLGLTATPERKDGIGLGQDGMFDHLVCAAQIGELVEAGFLVPCAVRGPGRKLKTGQLAQSPVDAYRKHAPGSSAVVFCHSVKAAHDAAETFRAAGFTAAAIDGTTEPEVRDDILARFAAGRLEVVCNMQVLTEGWDAPIASTCILARGCGSVGLYLQMVGRVLRAHPGKTGATLLDLRGVVHAAGFGMPDEDREYALEGAGIRRKGMAGGDRYCPVCKALVSGEWCAGCGTQLRDREGVELMGIELESLTLPQRMAKVPDDKRIVMLARFLRGAEAKGHKTASAFYKFKGTFGFMPPKHVVEAARSHLAAEDERRRAAGQ